MRISHVAIRASALLIEGARASVCVCVKDGVTDGKCEEKANLC